MREDFKRFTLLQKVLAVIDLILNPKAINWPFLLCDKNSAERSNLPKYHLVIKEFDKGSQHHFWCIRWLTKGEI